jgi:hypothetical protein
MPQFDERHVKLCGGIVVWDGVTQPETITVGQKAGGQKWTLKVVFEPHNPDIALFNQLAQAELMKSKWRGTLPAGGRMPVGTVQPGEFNEQFPGWAVISFKTSLKVPDVYDEHGAPVDPMKFSHVIYTGQKVDVLAHCYEYDAAGNRGISAGMDAFAVIQSAQMPRQQFGTSVNTAAAFGGGAAPVNTAPSPATGSTAPSPAPTQAHDFLPPAPDTAPPPVAEPQYRTPDGNAWTEVQLVASGWTSEQIHALPPA